MNDRVVLITGGAGNLGRAVTGAFLDAGARVAVPIYRTDSPSALDDDVREHEGRLLTFALDLTTERGSEQAIHQVVEWGGKLNSVIHLVGGYLGGTRVADTPLDVWNRMVEINATSAFLVARFSIPRMVEAGGGSFVFVSSRAAYHGLAERASYSAAKAALITLAKAIGEEYAADGIRSNVVLPDTIDTEANRLAMPDADFSRWTLPDDLARVILFLASDEAAVINGAAVPVYGSG